MDDAIDLSRATGDTETSVTSETLTIFKNARVVLADQVMLGRVVVRGGLIETVDDGDASAGADFVEDCNGDILMPGLIELHTDNIENHIQPRPSATWPALAAAIAHDAQIAGAGITTVYDSISLGAFDEANLRLTMLRAICDALRDGVSHDLFKARHALHLRCEVGFGGLNELLDPLVDQEMVGLISIMDHTPGQRQFADESKYRFYYQNKMGLTDEEMDVYMVDRREDQRRYSDKNRAYAVGLAHKYGHALASHDDATDAHVEEAVRDRMTIAEFPTTIEAAKASHEAGLAVLMGAPNLVRGGSHSGNVAAIELARLGYLDIVSSDYAPGALIHAAFLLEEQVDHMGLPEAIATVTRNPARAAGLLDRGEIAEGLKADLVRVKDTPHHPIIKGVWVGGERVS